MRCGMWNVECGKWGAPGRMTPRHPTGIQGTPFRKHADEVSPIYEGNHP
ncbi:MAG: hypothetical protein H7X99_00125 [Saprospiraceae bacterium]|nr:hypothetical protein [Saprospiraceae bacterium]